MLTNRIISTNNLSKTFNSARSLFARTAKSPVLAVRSVSLEVDEGEKVAFIGPNGAGKSTTIRMLSGLLIPSSGEATVCGLVPWNSRRTLSYRIGCVFGHRSGLWQGIPVQASFDILRDIFGIDEEGYKETLGSCSEIFGLSPLLKKDPKQLSLGERMRCDITASLLHGPKVLFLDEPSIGLDIEARLALRSLVRSACTERNVTVLLTSHDTGDIEGVCDRVVVINHGSVLFDSSMKDLRVRFMKEKVITLHTTSKALPFVSRGVTTRSQSENQICVEVDASVCSVESVIAELLRTNEVSDLLVEEKPFEEVIRELYQIGEEAA